MAAVDLISYSPWITPGDMHKLPFDDNTFDIIVLGWVLGYSSTPGQVANEVLRVAHALDVLYRLAMTAIPKKVYVPLSSTRPEDLTPSRPSLISSVNQ
jgi:ubiquinone/menaquinone biosynthesis C-methylase UbiE